MTEKDERLEAAKFDRALAAVKWEDAATTAEETGRGDDRREATKDSTALDAADQKVKRIKAEP